MKNRYTILLIFAMGFFPFVIMAQPVNDDCGGALDLTGHQDTCAIYDFADATDDMLEGNCEPGDLPGIWFYFEAQSPDLSLEAFTPGDETTYLTVYAFPTGSECDQGEAVEIACGIDSIEETGILTVSERYYIKLSSDPGDFPQIELCIGNPVDPHEPENDEPCFAKPISTDSICDAGSTIGATFDVDNPSCVEPSQASVWYKFTLSPNNTIVDISIENLSIDSTITAMLVQFDDPDCTGDFTYVNGSGICDTTDLLWTVENLDDDEEYYIQIATMQADTGSFRLCVNERIPPPSCGAYNPCSQAYQLNVPPADEPTYFTACNTGSLDGMTNFPATCYYMDNPTEWFSTDIYPNTSVLRILVESMELPKLQVAVYKGTSCNNLDPVQCQLETSNNGIEFLLDNIDQSATYFIAVTDAFGETGFFDIGIQQIVDESDCNMVKNLEVVNTSYGSPPGGPYQSGERVTFCYEITTWDPVNCNWLQGIVPFFGNGWDASSFQPNGRPTLVDTPLQTVSSGTWNWYSSGQVEYNLDNPDKGYFQGDPMPAGWYFVNSGSGGNDPDNSRGDGFICNKTDVYTWKVCFSVTALKYPQCDQSIPFNCSVQVQTFSDSEIGSHDQEGCLNDLAIEHSADLFCCEGPELQLQDTTTCLGQGFEKVFNTQGSASSEYFWNVIDADGVAGAESGQGDTLTADYTYIGSGPRTVVYEVYGENNDGCLSELKTWNVTIYPELTANISNVDSVCRGITIILGGSPTASGGNPPYNYDWSHGIPSESNPPATINSPSNYSVTVTDQAGCAATDGEFIAIYRQPTAEISGGGSICEGETATIQLEFTGEPPFQYTLSVNGMDQSPSLTAQSSVTLQVSPDATTVYELSAAEDDRCTANVSGEAIVTVNEPTSSSIERTICFGEGIQIGNESFDKTGMYQIVLEGQNHNGCDSIVNLDLTVNPEILLQDTTIQADNGSGNGSIFPIWGGGTPPYSFLWNDGSTTANISGLESGTYSVTVTDANDCSKSFSFFVDMETAINPIQGSQLSGIEMYPNPLNEQYLYFTWQSPREHILRVVNYQGRTVDRAEMEAGEKIRYQWPEHLGSGLYYIEIQTRDGRGYFPLIYHR